MGSFVIGPLSFVLKGNADDADFQTRIDTDQFSTNLSRSSVAGGVGRDQLCYKDRRANAPYVVVGIVLATKIAGITPLIKIEAPVPLPI